MRINDAKGKLKVGDWVRINSAGQSTVKDFPVEGEIGEIDDDAFYVWQDTDDGKKGKINPTTWGYKYSWKVYWEQKNEAQDAYVEILKRN